VSYALAPPLELVDQTCVSYRGRVLAYFGGCDYFRLSRHPAVLEALRAGLNRYGLNVAASRLTTGNHRLYEQLERRLADFFGVEAAAVVSSGYVTNLVVAQALAGHFTHVLIDELAHKSLVDAAAVFHCTVKPFAHRDVAAVGVWLRRAGARAKPVLLTDGLFSHDGRLAPLDGFLQALPPRAALLVDEAHAAGTLGKTGRGTLEALGVRDQRIIRTITLSKAFGVYGGAVFGSRQLIQGIHARSSIFAGNTPLPLPLVCAALKSVEIVAKDHALRERLRRNAAQVKDALRQIGWPVTETPAPIISCAPRRRADRERLKRKLLAAGIYPSFIRYPGGPVRGYFRFALSSEHTPEQLERLGAVLREFARATGLCAPDNGGGQGGREKASR
jgi:7-keto-8-aminopelargonate synthetase-like enzyme